jgi:ribonuclease D
MENGKKPAFSISKDEINELPAGGFRGRITTVFTEKKAEEAAQTLLRHGLIGFDTETKPTFRKGQKQNPIALMQLSTERHAFLFRINETGMTPGLRKVLESPGILKIGQALKYELRTMKKELGITGRGFVDLLDIAHKLDCEPKSVRGMAALFLGIRISKSMQVTNWERGRLSGKQKRYAATDAWACLAVYGELKKRKLLERSHGRKHR